MFVRDQRLPLTPPFKATTTVRSPSFTGKYASNNLSYNRYAVIVGKKVEKRAVNRNRLRRKVLSFLQTYDTQMQQGIDLLVILTPQVVTIEKSLDTILTDFLHKQHLLESK